MLLYRYLKNNYIEFCCIVALPQRRWDRHCRGGEERRSVPCVPGTAWHPAAAPSPEENLRGCMPWGWEEGMRRGPVGLKNKNKGSAGKKVVGLVASWVIWENRKKSHIHTRIYLTLFFTILSAGVPISLAVGLGMRVGWAPCQWALMLMVLLGLAFSWDSDLSNLLGLIPGANANSACIIATYFCLLMRG